VQVAPTVAATDWLLSLAAYESRICGVVGWAPLDDADDPSLARLGEDPRCVGVRPMRQDMPEDDWLERHVRRETLEQVAASGLVFDVPACPAQLGPALRALERVPELVVVVDHLGEPPFDHDPDDWADLIRAFAARPHTHCKLSGLIGEVPRGFDRDGFRRHVEIVVEAFGPGRVLFGSDWPVCLTAGTHAEVIELADWLTRELEPAEREAVFGGNAARVYNV
jgi:L-fuconolactonase